MAALPTIYVNKPSTHDPPPKTHISESARITAKWYKHFYKDPRPDNWHTRKPIHEVDPDKLQVIINPQTSCKIVDHRMNKLIAVVLHGIVSEGGEGAGNVLDFLAWVANTIKDGVLGRHSVQLRSFFGVTACTINHNLQLEDSGMLIQTGHTAEVRSKPTFGWVCSILCK